MKRAASLKLACACYVRTVAFAAVITIASVDILLAEDINKRQHWWGFTALHGWPQVVSIWQDLNEITIVYTGDRWCSTKARLTSANTFEKFSGSCEHLEQQATTIRLSRSGDRLKYQIINLTDTQATETGYLLPIN